MTASELGYIFDFLAGVLIIQSIIFRSKKMIDVESATYWDQNPFAYESQLKAFWDGWLGSFLLFVGLILHLIHDVEFNLMITSIIVITTLVLIWIFMKVIRKRISKYIIKRFPHYTTIKEKEGLK